MKDHSVASGECLTSIAFDNGFHWKTLWDHPGNAELKQARHDPFSLAPGDVVHVPDLEVKPYLRATGATHTFRRKGVPAKLKLQLQRPDGTLRADEPYELTIDGKPVPGELKTDSEGRIEHFMAPNAVAAMLRLDGGKEEYALQLGHILPIEDDGGVQARLANLGFYHEPSDGEEAEALEAAVQDFQVCYGLEPSGKLDDATREKLRAAYGG
jgi:N-acetylmuramoyl-L-alanine amidase